MICPKCADVMQTHERNGVHIEQCVECKGIFLDRGELEQLTAAGRQYYSDHANPEPAPAPPRSAPAGRDHIPEPQEYYEPPREYAGPLRERRPYDWLDERDRHDHEQYRKHSKHGKRKKKKDFFEALFDL